MGVPTTYQAYQYEQYGAADAELRLCKTVQQRELAPNQLRIKVHSAALNPADHMVLEQFGLAITGDKPTKEHPFGMGFDVAGTVVEAGADASRFAVGDAVYAMTPFSSFGTFAEYVVIDEQFVGAKPKNLSFEQAASVPYAALTSYQALVEHAKLQKGDRVLILGGSTSTGIFAVGLAHALGAHVTATAMGCQDYLFIKSLGADEVIDASKTKWVDAVTNHSVDIIYDCGVDRNAWNRDAQFALKPETGRFVTLNPMMHPRPAKFGATNLGEIRVHPCAKQIGELTKLIESGALTTQIDSVYPFEELLGALDKLKSKKVRGKIVLQVDAKL